MEFKTNHILVNCLLADCSEKLTCKLKQYLFKFGLRLIQNKHIKNSKFILLKHNMFYYRPSYFNICYRAHSVYIIMH